MLLGLGRTNTAHSAVRFWSMFICKQCIGHNSGVKQSTTGVGEKRALSLGIYKVNFGPDGGRGGRIQGMLPGGVLVSQESLSSVTTGSWVMTASIMPGFYRTPMINPYSLQGLPRSGYQMDKSRGFWMIEGTHSNVPSLFWWLP